MLRNWGTHTTFPMGHSSGLRWTIRVFEIWSTSLCRIYWNLIFLVKTGPSSVVSRWLFWWVSFCFWQKAVFYTEKTCFSLQKRHEKIIFHRKLYFRWKIPTNQPFLALLLTLILTTHGEFLELKVFLRCSLQNVALGYSQELHPLPWDHPRETSSKQVSEQW